jgi:hypothetical protein
LPSLSSHVHHSSNIQLCPLMDSVLLSKKAFSGQPLEPSFGCHWFIQMVLLEVTCHLSFVQSSILFPVLILRGPLSF